MTGLRLDGLGIRHDGQQIVRDVSLRIEQGDSLCLIGASGGGKSLIAAAVAGLLPDCMAASGRIGLHDREMPAANQDGLRALWHSHTCRLPQEPTAALAPLLRAADQVRLASRRSGGPRRWRGWPASALIGRLPNACHSRCRAAWHSGCWRR